MEFLHVTNAAYRRGDPFDRRGAIHCALSASLVVHGGANSSIDGTRSEDANLSNA